MRSLVPTLLAVFLFSSFSPALGAELVADAPDFDFGEIVQGDKAEHTFHFRNAGDGDLVIEQVRSSCGCTAALLSATRIPSGGDGEVKAAFDSRGFRGPVSKSVYLYSNDRSKPVTELRVRAVVRPEVEFSPDPLDFGVLAAGTTREFQVTVTNRGHHPLAFSSVRATGEGLSAHLRTDRLAPGESGVLFVKVAPSPETRTLGGYLLLTAEGASSPNLRLAVHGVLTYGQ